jgi:hypothetical protein
MHKAVNCHLHHAPPTKHWPRRLHKACCDLPNALVVSPFVLLDGKCGRPLIAFDEAHIAQAA